MGAELKNLGPGGREIKNKAEEYIINGKNNVPQHSDASRAGGITSTRTVLEEDNSMLEVRKINSE